MKMKIPTIILAAHLLAFGSAAKAAGPLLLAWPAAQWIGGLLLFTPIDELAAGGAVAGGLGLAGKQAIKHAAKPKGPIVKSGPTAGNVRSRNSDGTWRKKRSDAGKPRD